MALAPLADWANFYVITGSCAGGLTGLTFVVIALVAEARITNRAGLHTFVTPTIVHFAAVLALAAFLCMPRQTALSVAIGLVLLSVAGLVYCGLICVNLRRSAVYTPVREDWIWNAILPAVSYGDLCAMAWLVRHHPEAALYGVGAASMLLLFIGIHNAWDIAVWMTLRRHEDAPGKQAKSAATAREQA